MENEFENLKHELALEVGALRTWIAGLSADKVGSEWEASFEDWPRLTKVFTDFLDSCGPDVLDGRTIDLMLYALARDQEAEVLKQELIKRPRHLLHLAQSGIQNSERNARWQLADALGYLQANSGVDELLEQYFGDSDEYVRRRALLALGRRKSPKTEKLACNAWETGDEHQRMATLEALRLAASALLPRFLDLAKEDGRKSVTTFAARIR